jgi:hypothetical protein
MQGPDTDAQDQPPPFTHIRLAPHGQKPHLREVRFWRILLQKSAYTRRGTADTMFLKPSVATRWIVRAAYARLY